MKLPVAMAYSLSRQEPYLVTYVLYKTHCNIQSPQGLVRRFLSGETRFSFLK